MNTLEVIISCRTGGQLVSVHEDKNDDYSQQEIEEIAINELTKFILMTCVLQEIRPYLDDFECEVISKFDDKPLVIYKYKLASYHIVNKDKFCLQQIK